MKEEIDEVLKIIRKIMKHMDVLYGIENPVFKDLKHDRDLHFQKTFTLAAEIYFYCWKNKPDEYAG